MANSDIFNNQLSERHLTISVVFIPNYSDSPWGRKEPDMTEAT